MGYSLDFSPIDPKVKIQNDLTDSYLEASTQETG
jgi:hypothetical protein